METTNQRGNTPITLDYMNQLVVDFWAKNGSTPTHAMVTLEQQQALSDYMKPQERNPQNSEGLPGYGVVTFVTANGLWIDLITVNPLRSGQTYSVSYPIILNLNSGE